MLDLGTGHTKLWRSSKNEWFGDTPGFCWGDNNAKDLTVRLEDYPDPMGNGGYIPYVPYGRDRKWTELYEKYKGQIDEQFGFLAFRTAPLVSPYTMDAKVLTSEMAQNLMVWAAFGKPNQREWLPRKTDFAKDDGLYPSGYYLFQGTATPQLAAMVKEKEETRMAALAKPARALKQVASGKSAPDQKAADDPPPNYDNLVWKGWVLPASDNDMWFVAGAAAYRRVLLSKDPVEGMEAKEVTWRGLEVNPDTASYHFRKEQTRGVLFLAALRKQMGDKEFFKMMNDYFTANTTKTVTAQSFLEFAKVKGTEVDPPEGPSYLASDIWERLNTAVIVFGTMREAGANRYAAEQLQGKLLDNSERTVPIYKDYEVTAEVLKAHDVIFVGRPEANLALAAWRGQLGLGYSGAAFKVNGKTYASEQDALIWAGKNPVDGSRMVLVLAGNDALRTVKAQKTELPETQFLIVHGTGEPVKGFAERSQLSASRQ